MRLPIPDYTVPANLLFDWLGGWLLIGFCSLLALGAMLSAAAVGVGRLRFQRLRSRRPRLVEAAVKVVQLGGRYGTQRAH
jgi:hypothetical protein